MEILQLTYFCDAAQTENFSKTAKKFGVPPSGVSQSIGRLEREVGTALFLRRANRVTLSEQGRHFYEQVSLSLSILQNAVDEVTDREDTGKIRLCLNNNRRIVMEGVEQFRQCYPNVELIVSHFTDPAAEEFDLIVDSRDPAVIGYNKTLFLSEDILLAMRRDSPYANMELVDLSVLSQSAFVSLGEKSGLYQLTHDICRDFGFTPRIVMQGDDPFYVRKCIEMGLGLCFVPAFTWQGQFSQDIICKPVGAYKRNSYLYTPSHRHLPQRVRNFIRILKSEVANI